MTTDRQPPNHNSRNCVKWYACQLPECRDHYNARRRAIRAGLTQPRQLVDAEPVRQHILDLQQHAGLSPTRIARLAGVSHTTICSFLHALPSSGRGRRRETSPETAAKILAVRPLTTIGALRRIQALIAIGWPARKIAANAGVSARWLIEVRPTTVINIVTAEKIAAAYQQLRHLTPEKNDVWPGHAKRARNRAAANRWPTPTYWDQHPDAIDDPHFEPLYGITRREIVAQDAHWLIQSGGLDRAAAAERLGVSKSYIEHALAAHPHTEQELAA